MKSLTAYARGLAALAFLSVSTAWAAQDLNVYGPGGPAPAMKEAAEAFGRSHGVKVHITAGPTPAWAGKAKQDADVLFSGAENMMSGFASALPGVFDLRDARTLYLRPSAILVRPGNPKGISGFKDLLKPGIKVMAVAGAGQTGLWEDVAGRLGNIETVRAFRANLVLPEAANSAMARTQWTEDKSIDAWLIWNIWQVSNPALASMVEVEQPYRIYRGAGAVVTQRGKQHPQAQAFVDYLASDDGKAIFKKWGWKVD
ncbi:substrate-binding domain-containing protein [Achromobacter spanius]|uniref:substrate-binding domain-containing protein n=1 Tax=Achromobacter spanius TaxID=217203 RepID=UPI003A8F3CD1